MSFKYEDIKTQNYNKEQRFVMISMAQLLSRKKTFNEELQKEFGLKDREVRSYITAIKYNLPVISLSGKKGYKIANCETDVNELQSSINEDLSRVREILYTTLPKLKFLKENNLDYNVEKPINDFIFNLNKTRRIQSTFNIDIDKE